MNIAWQSALPPTICAICVSILYIQYTTVRQVSAPISHLGLLRILVRDSSPERGTLTFSFLDTITTLDAGCPADDREALRSFAVLHGVRCAPIKYHLYFGGSHAISGVVYSNAQSLQPDEYPTAFMSTLTVPTEVLYRDARGGDVARGEIVAGRGLTRTVDFVV